MARIAGADFQERLADAFGELTATERKVAAYIGRHPDEVVDQSAMQIAAAAGTSDATVIRTVQRLGYRGLNEVKREFLENVLRRRDMSASLDRQIGQAMAATAPVHGVLAASAEVIETFRAELDQSAIDAAVDRMAVARTVYVQGLGPGSLIAASFALTLTRLGIRAEAMMHSGYRIADDLLPLSGDDCVVIFAPFHQTTEVEAVVEHAREVGAAVVLITEALGVSLGTRVDVVIKTPSTISNLASEMLIPHTLSVALGIQLAARERSRAADRGALFNRIAARFTGSLGMPSPPFVSSDVDSR